jgi:hypothetical protein
MEDFMITARQLARRKEAVVSSSHSELMGPYDHKAQRRWVGEDASLIQWTMKSDTSFDHESKDPD